MRQPHPLISRFRILRELIEKDSLPTDERLGEILACFPDGWARRRALSSLIRAGHPDSLEAAITLVESLTLPRHRRWCASDLVHSRRLTPDELALVNDHLLASGDRIIDNAL